MQRLQNVLIIMLVILLTTAVGLVFADRFVSPPAQLAPQVAEAMVEATLTSIPSSTPRPSATALPTATRTPSPLPSATPLPTLTPVPVSEPVRVLIEAIDLDRTLLPVGLDANRIPIVPDHDVGWYTLSARPGEGENIVLWGHALRFLNAPEIPAPFGRLSELPIGARISLVDESGQTHHYQVVEQIWATPDQVEFILPHGSELLTLVSCIGEKVIIDGGLEMSHRLITRAMPIE